MNTRMKILLTCLLACMTSNTHGQIQWTKSQHNPILRPGQDVGDNASFDTRWAWMPMVMVENDTCKMWYVGLKDGVYSVGYAASADGIHWEKYPGNPVLSPGPPSTFDQGGIWGGTVLRDGPEYKMYYSGSPSGLESIGLATSEDGTTWTKRPAPILVPGAPGSWEEDGVHAPCVRKEAEGRYLMWYTGIKQPTAAIGLATSADGITWTKHPGNPILIPDSAQAWDSYIVTDARVVRFDSAYHMFYHGTPGTIGYQIGYAASTDGINWTRYASNPVLRLGPPGSWDVSSLSQHTVRTTDSSFLIWYGAKGYDGRFRIGLAESPYGSFHVTPSQIDAGFLAVGESSSRTFTVWNDQASTSLVVSSVEIQNPDFAVDHTAFSVPPLSSAVITLTYTPLAAGEDSSDLTIRVSEPAVKELHVMVHGAAFQPAAEPVIRSITDVPNDNGGQVHIVWHRSILDTAEAALPMTQYAIWRRLDLTPAGTQATATRTGVWHGSTWEYLTAVPAAHFTTYAVTAATSCGPQPAGGICWNVYLVTAHSSSGAVYASAPDSGFSISNYPSTHASDGQPLPRDFQLAQNYPNPFNPETIVSFDVPRAAPVRVTLYDLLGCELRRMVDDHLAPGHYTVRLDGHDLASGLYLCVMRSEGFVATRKLLLIR